MIYRHEISSQLATLGFKYVYRPAVDITRDCKSVRGDLSEYIRATSVTRTEWVEKKFKKKEHGKNVDNDRPSSVFTPSDSSEYVRARADLHHHVLLHQVKAHGDQGHAQHQVHGAQYEAELDALDGVRPGAGPGGVAARHEVAEPYGAQRYETEVRPVEELPVFPFGEQHGATGYVSGKNKKKKKFEVIITDRKLKIKI